MNLNFTIQNHLEFDKTNSFINFCRLTLKVLSRRRIEKLQKNPQFLSNYVPTYYVFWELPKQVVPFAQITLFCRSLYIRVTRIVFHLCYIAHIIPACVCGKLDNMIIVIDSSNIMILSGYFTHPEFFSWVGRATQICLNQNNFLPVHKIFQTVLYK